MIRFMKASNKGTVNAVSPWLGLQIMPLVIKELRTGPASSGGGDPAAGANGFLIGSIEQL